MTLHEWIDDVCDALDLDTEVDEGLVLDVTRDAAHAVTRVAGPVTAYLLGYAAASSGGAPREVAELATRISELAASWQSGRSTADAAPGTDG